MRNVVINNAQDEQNFLKSNESNLFHEAVHGYTGVTDGAIWLDLSSLDNTISANTSSYKITLYIQRHVLNACPISTR